MAVTAVLALLFAYIHRDGQTPVRVSEQSLAPERTLSADEIYARVSPAVFQVVIRDEHDREIGSGSGFLVSTKGLIATNFHVVEEAHSARVILADKTELPVIGVAAFDEHSDIAIIKVAGQLSAQPLELAGNDLPPIGTKVFAIGNPRGLARTLSDGLVSGHQEIPIRSIKLIQTTAPISPGSSGGPLLGANGKVVGVTAGSRIDGQNLNFAVPAAQVARLLLRCDGETQLTRLPLVREPSAFTYLERGKAWRKKGEYDKAINDFDEAIRLEPKNSSAYYNRGFAWHLKKVNDKAIKDYDEAIRLDPTNAFYYCFRGDVWFAKMEFDIAIGDYNAAIRLDPKNALFHNNLGDA
jgi:S1-C subfamily serine protease